MSLHLESAVIAMSIASVGGIVEALALCEKVRRLSDEANTAHQKGFHVTASFRVADRNLSHALRCLRETVNELFVNIIKQ